MIPIGAIFPIDPPQQKKTQKLKIVNTCLIFLGTKFKTFSRNLIIFLIKLHNDMHSHYIVYL